MTCVSTALRSQNQGLAMSYPPLPESGEALEDGEGAQSDDEPGASVATAHSQDEEEEQPPQVGASPPSRKRGRSEEAQADATSEYVCAADESSVAIDPSLVHDVLPLAYKPPLLTPPPKKPCLAPIWDLGSDSDDE